MANDDTKNDAGFIGRVVEDPNNPPQTRLLTGWLGDAADAAYRRLYTDAELSSYVDIPEDAILYSETMRDVQPSGCVFVWIRREAAVKQGGTAASRAGSFLQGQVAQDFSSPQKAGYRCVTQTPCGEPTGFTGRCTQQPEVGGAWPCITAVPLCTHPTGFTGQCTEHPWPNPTQYHGCTVLHCPGNDLTHQPHICNQIATGAPGCGGGQPQARGEENPQGGGGSQPDAPATSIPGCGYTKQWGLCETQLLGCGFTKDWGPNCPDTQLLGCGFTQNWGPQCPTQMPGCGWTQQWGLCNDTQAPQCQPSVQNPCVTYDAACNDTQAPLCQPSVQNPCVTYDAACNVAPLGNEAAEGQFGGPRRPPSSIGVDCLAPSVIPLTCGVRPPVRSVFLPCLRPTIVEPRCHRVLPSPVCLTFPTPGPWDFDPRPMRGLQQFGAPQGAAGGAQQFGGGGGGIQLTVMTVPVWRCGAPTPASQCFVCPTPISVGPPRCPPPPSPWLCTAPPSPFCPPRTPFCPTPRTRFCPDPISRGIACTVVQCGGGGASAVDGCPTRICDGGGHRQFFGAGAGGAGAEAAQVGVTGWQGCTHVGPQCPVGPTGWQGCGQHEQGGGQPGTPIGHTGWQGCTYFGPQCPIGPTGWQGCGGEDPQQNAAFGTWPTPATHCFIC